MKELSIEEKAQRYDEALDCAKKALDCLADDYICNHLTKDDIRGMYAKLFPELNGSKDEKIRKEIINYINFAESHNLLRAADYEKKKGWITWLEKQGEQKPANNRLIPQKREYYVCIKDYYSADGKTTNAKGKIYKSPCDGYINDDKGFGLSWINSCTENYFRPIKEEDWIICEQNNVIGKPLQYKEFMNNKLIQKNIKSLEDKGIVPNFRLWDISDAKDGDVLAYNDGSLTIFRYRLSGLDAGLYMSHVLLTDKIEFKQTCAISNSHPATKEQRDTLMKAMADAGYTFNFEKKELKKIEQKSAMDEQNHALNDEDIRRYNSILSSIKYCSEQYPCKKEYDKDINWLKDRVQPQPKKEWSEEDEAKLKSILFHIEDVENKDVIDWLKSLRPQSQWKPSEEQMGVIEAVINNRSFQRRHLDSLYEQLKKLREE